MNEDEESLLNEKTFESKIYDTNPTRKMLIKNLFRTVAKIKN